MLRFIHQEFAHNRLKTYLQKPLITNSQDWYDVLLLLDPLDWGQFVIPAAGPLLGLLLQGPLVLDHLLPLLLLHPLKLLVDGLVPDLHTGRYRIVQATVF